MYPLVDNYHFLSIKKNAITVCVGNRINLLEEKKMIEVCLKLEISRNKLWRSQG